ncbi:MAG: TlpA disulfide reductase family protein [Candidatus Competibacteraceae bacterium]|nr:TlpA disulfide reductase family protein [Candidatus Competibacteraceae bacterium]
MAARSLWGPATGLLLMGLTITAYAVSPETTRIADPYPAPDFTLQDLEGNRHNLSDYRGEVVVVNFWATWCIPCRKEFPSMERAWQETRDQGVHWLGVDWGDDQEAVEIFLDSLPVELTFPLLLGGDEAMTEAWGVRGLPTTFIIGPDNRVHYRIVGEKQWDDPELLKQILALKQSRS